MRRSILARLAALVAFALAFAVTPHAALRSPVELPAVVVLEGQALAAGQPTGTVSTSLQVQPIGGSADDSVRICALLNANGYTREIVLGPGTYQWKNPCRVHASGVRVRALAGVSIVAGLTVRVTPTVPYNAVFSVGEVEAASPIDMGGVLAAAVPAGSTQVTVTGLSATPANGSSIGLIDTINAGAANQQAAYIVTGGVALSANIAGAGPFTGTVVLTPFGGSPFTTTLSAESWTTVDSKINGAIGNGGQVTAHTDQFTTGVMTLSSSLGPIVVGAGTANSALGLTAGTAIGLDRPTLYRGASSAGWPSGAEVTRFTRVADFSFTGNATSVSGTMERFVTNPAALRARISGLNILATGITAEFAVSCDSQSFDCRVSDVTCRDGSTTCVALEAAEQCSADHIVCTNSPGSTATNACLLAQAAHGVTFRRCEATGRSGGSGALLFVGQSTDPQGSEDVSIVDSLSVGNTNGVVVAGGSQRTSILNTAIVKSVSHGIWIFSDTGKVAGYTTIIGGSSVNGGGYGVYVDGGAAASSPGNTVWGTVLTGNSSGASTTANSGSLVVK